MMRAWWIEAHGGLDVLQWVERPLPEPRPGEARVRVQTVGLNHLDLWVRRGVEGHRFPLPMIPGVDVVGVIDQITLPSGNLKPGMPVIVNPIISCGSCRSCLNGLHAACETFGLIGESQDGGCAEFVVVPVQNLIPLPASLSVKDAVTLPTSAVTAWSMVHRKAKIQKGDTVLIHAGGSGVSIFAIQLAHACGARVLTTVGSPEKAEKLKALGAEHVILYREVDFKAEVKRLVGRRGVDVVLDHVGSDTFLPSLKCLAWGGRYVFCGATSGSEVSIDLKALFFKNQSILGTTMGGKADLWEVLKLVETGILKPVIDSEFSLVDLPKAHERLESRQAFGKIILTAQHQP